MSAAALCIGYIACSGARLPHDTRDTEMVHGRFSASVAQGNGGDEAAYVTGRCTMLPNHYPLPATVTLFQQGRVVGVQTAHDDGRFEFLGLAPGTYSVAISFAGDEAQFDIPVADGAGTFLAIQWRPPVPERRGASSRRLPKKSLDDELAPFYWGQVLIFETPPRIESCEKHVGRDGLFTRIETRRVSRVRRQDATGGWLLMYEAFPAVSPPQQGVAVVVDVTDPSHPRTMMAVSASWSSARAEGRLSLAPDTFAAGHRYEIVLKLAYSSQQVLARGSFILDGDCCAIREGDDLHPNAQPLCPHGH